MNEIAVVGAGFMGSGIAQLAAQKGFQVTLIDRDPGQLDRSMASMGHYLGRLAQKGGLDAPAETVLSRISPSQQLEDASRAEMVLEAIVEQAEEKKSLLRALDACCPPEVPFGSNTSTIPIGLLAEATRHPERVVGAHFFFPVPLNPLLEVIPSKRTAPEVMESVLQFGRRLGKHTVLVRKDVPGFIMNRVFGALTCEAIRLVEQGVAGIEEVDGGLVAGYGMVQGPLAKADMAGLDVCLLAFQNIHEMGGGPEPPALLRSLVASGHLGRKSGQGFYRWDAAGRCLGPSPEDAILF